jgi:hypothetical protein
MFRKLSLILLLLTLSLPAIAASVTVTINGKPVTIPVIESGGKAYLDVVTLMRLLGGKATYDAKTHKVFVATTSPTAGGTAAPGTAQLAGDNGELGKVYSIRKEGPLYFCLTEAEFTTEQVRIGDTLHSPNADQKLLVLHFTLQNPEKSDQYVRFDSLKFTAVDATNVNREATADWADEENQGKVALALKPAQKIAVYTVIAVPAKGPMPKLMVLPEPEDNGPVLRYDLRDKGTPLQPPVADPADETGVTALERVPVAVGSLCHLGNFDVTVEKLEYTTDAMEGNAPEEEGRFLVATVLLTNRAPSEQYVRYDAITPVLASTDGEELTYHNMLTATGDRSFAQNLAAGQEVRVRLYFTVPKGVTPKSLAIKEGESRTYDMPVAE